MKKIKLIYFTLSIFAVISFFGFTSNCYAATSYNPSITMKVINSNENNQEWYLNVREKANTQANIIGVLREGDTVEVIKTGAKWAQISKTTLVRDITTNEYKKLTQYGYCSLEFLEQIYMPDYNTYTTIAKTKVFSKTSSSSTALKTLPKNKIVKVVGSTSSWYKLSTGGYCLKKYFGKTMTVSRTSELNVRKGPGTQYEIAYTLKEAMPVAVISTKNGWAKLEDGNYCSINYLLNPEKQIINEILLENSYYAKNNAEIRKEPNKSSAIINTINALTPIEVIDMLPGGWYKLQNGGYIQKDNVASNFR